MYKHYIEKVIILFMNINGGTDEFTELLNNIDYKRYFYSVLGESDSVKFEFINHSETEIQVRILLGKYTYKENIEASVTTFIEKYKRLIHLTNYKTNFNEIQVY